MGRWEGNVSRLIFWHDLYHLEVSRYFVDLRGPVGGMDAIRKFQLAYEEVIQELQPYERVQVEFINFLGNRETGWLVNAADGISSVREGIKSLLDQENLAQFCRDKIWYRNLLPLNVNRDNPKDVREYLEEAGQRFIAVAEVALTRMH